MTTTVTMTASFDIVLLGARCCSKRFSESMHLIFVMTYEAGTIVPILRMRKPRHEKDLLLARGPLSDQALVPESVLLLISL